MRVIHRIVTEFLRQADGSVPRFRLLRFAQQSASNGQILYFVFVNGRAWPAHVVRLPRHSRGLEKMKEEINSFNGIAGRVVGLRGIPARRAVCHEHSFVGIGEEAFAGRTLNHRGGRESDLSRALSWLGEFQKRTRMGEQSWKEIHNSMVVCIEKYEERYGKHPDLPAVADGLCARADQEGSSNVPLVAEHGDFAGYNILLHRSAVCIVDWEWCTSFGKPLHDALFLILTDSMTSSGTEARLTAIVERFKLDFSAEQNPNPKTVRLLAQFIKETGWAREWVAVSFLSLLLERAVRVIDQPGEGEGPGSLYRYLVEQFVAGGGKLALVDSLRRKLDTCRVC